MNKKFLLFIILLLGIIIFGFACQGQIPSGPEEDQENDFIFIINNIEVNPLQINGSGNVDLTIDVESTVGTTITEVSVVFFSPRQLSTKEGAFIEERLDYDSTHDVFTGSININSYSEIGDWKLGAILIYDDKYNMWSDYYIDPDKSTEKYVVGNYSYYKYNPDSAVSTISDNSITGINVIGTTPDLIFPVLNSYDLSPDFLVGSGNIIIELDITEAGGSGIYNVMAGICVRNNNGYGYGYATTCFYNSSTGKYECNMKRDLINDPTWIAEEGTYYVDYIEIIDNAGNKVSYEYESDKSSEYLVKTLSDNYSNYSLTSIELQTIDISN